MPLAVLWSGAPSGITEGAARPHTNTTAQKFFRMVTGSSYTAAREGICRLGGLGGLVRMAGQGRTRGAGHWLTPGGRRRVLLLGRVGRVREREAAEAGQERVAGLRQFQQAARLRHGLVPLPRTTPPVVRFPALQKQEEQRAAESRQRRQLRSLQSRNLMRWQTCCVMSARHHATVYRCTVPAGSVAGS